MNQSTEKMSAMSSVGNPAACNTITVVTSPALGMAAAPMDAPAAVSLTGEVKVKGKCGNTSQGHVETNPGPGKQLEIVPSMNFNILIWFWLYSFKLFRKKRSLENSSLLF